MSADRKCLMQKGMMVSVEWCLKAQYQEICGRVWGKGRAAKRCDYNEGFSESVYQKEKRNNSIIKCKT